MLQISTGKFFASAEVEETLHRGTFFTNYRIFGRENYETACGRLLPSAPFSKLITLTCETTERLAKTRPDGSRSILISIGSGHMLSDFAAITSFALNITCTPDPDLTRRLISANAYEPSGASAPNKYLKRVFDAEVLAKEGDDQVLSNLMTKLMSLDRKSYEGAIRAIRRYVGGTHRISDDVDLAYALFVASVESLAQDFDGFVPRWQGVPQDRRLPIDAALQGVDDTSAEKVRLAIMAREGQSLARRYKEFALAHITPAFFRAEAKDAIRPIRRADLERLLDRAYSIRSKYVHQLTEIPRNVSFVHDYSEIAYDDGEDVLTFQGIARLSRHVILNFIESGQEVETEEFHWPDALPNTAIYPVAPQHWVWDEKGYSAKTANRYLSGFLEQVAGILEGTGERALSDMRAVLRSVEQIAPGLNSPTLRRPLLLLHYLYNNMIGDQFRSEDHGVFFEKFAADFEGPYVETAVAYIVQRRSLEWSLDDAETMHQHYFSQRRQKRGLLLNPFFETALSLAVAETAIKNDRPQVAINYVGHAVENNPAKDRLVALETALRSGERTSFKWQEIWLPSTEGS